MATEAIAPQDLPAVERCLATGVLESEGNALRFRHEIARSTIEESLPPDRYVALHRATLRVLAGRADPARLAHHADAAGDAAAVIEHAKAAATRASALSAHREAAEQYDRALRHADELRTATRADLFERAAAACYLTGRFDDAVAHGRDALDAIRTLGDARREGVLLLALARYVWYCGDTSESNEMIRRAAAVEKLPPARSWPAPISGSAARARPTLICTPRPSGAGARSRWPSSSRSRSCSRWR